MIETYSDTLTEIEDLGSGTNAVSTQTRICDRCGFQKMKEQLIKEDASGRYVCKDCYDQQGPKRLS